MSKKISQDQIQQLRDKYSSDNHVKVVRNAMIKTNSNELSMDWEKYRKIDHSFSHHHGVQGDGGIHGWSHSHLDECAGCGARLGYCGQSDC